MVDFHFEYEWVSYPDDDRNIGETTAKFRIHVDGLCLTRNEDSSGVVRDHVMVSMYPLAMWFASSWWRLNHEVFPAKSGEKPDHDWLMSHQLTAVDMGFVWPNITFVPDADGIQIRALATQDCQQTPTSVKYLNGFDESRTVSREEFAREVSSLVNRVIVRLDEAGQKDSELAQLWALVLKDRVNSKEYQKRRIEAKLGFDPDDCPEHLIRQTISLEDGMQA